MAKNQKRIQKKSKKRTTKRKRSWCFGLFIMMLVMIVVVAAWLVYLDRIIIRQFEGRRWELPAHVYAAPELLFSGANISTKQLELHLRNLGYRSVSLLTQAGEFKRNGQIIDLYSRSFDFFNGERSGKVIRVKFSDPHIEKVTDKATGQTLNTYRLEPLLIGGIYPTHQEDRLLVSLEDVPSILVHGLIASEDRDFYNHSGISLKGILRAIRVNMDLGKIKQGGSTLTQQLVKNYFLNSERTLWRKVREAAMSLLLELNYSKSEILEAYINEVYMGQDGNRSINGFGLASFYYFKRPLKELTVEQIATLVALVRGPSFYNPFRHPKLSKKRRDLILQHLAKGGYITKSDSAELIESPLSVNRKGKKSYQNRYPSFLTLVKQQLKRDYRNEDLRSEGLRIFTTLVPRIQRSAEISAQQRLRQLEQTTQLPIDQLQVAVIITNPDNAEVLALIGDRHARQQGFNRALHAYRPVGSLIKPVIYLTALDKPQEYHLATLLSDEPLKMENENDNSWHPQNYDKQIHGEVLLMNGLAKSNNLASVRLGMDLSLDEVNKTLARLGVKKRMHYPSALLGAIEMSPLEVAQLYQNFASGGFAAPLQSVSAVMDRQGKLLQRFPLVIHQTLDSASVYQLNFAMHYSTIEGTSKSIKLRMPNTNAAGKTGTTDDLRDSWFAGFTGDRMGVVWIGRDGNETTELTGASGALQLWIDIMQNISELSYQANPPENIVMARVDDKGQVVSEDCGFTYELPFRQTAMPATSKCKHPKNNVLNWIKGIFR